MKTFNAVTATPTAVRWLSAFALSIATMAVATAQTGGMSGMPMEDSKTAPQTSPRSDATTHQASGVVKKVDAAANKVTIAHGPVPTLKWPAMTMTFAVKDKGLMSQLPAGKNVQVTFKKEGNDFVITSVK